jgi:hypothetical protein
MALTLWVLGLNFFIYFFVYAIDFEDEKSLYDAGSPEVFTWLAFRPALVGKNKGAGSADKFLEERDAVSVVLFLLLASVRSLSTYWPKLEKL